MAEFNEGVHVTFDNLAMPLHLAKNFYGRDDQVIYISHRINSYSNNPLDLPKVLKVFPNFKHAAVVTKNWYVRGLVFTEKLFVNVPVRIFENLDSAFSWAGNLLENSSKSQH